MTALSGGPPGAAPSRRPLGRRVRPEACRGGWFWLGGGTGYGVLVGLGWPVALGDCSGQLLCVVTRGSLSEVEGRFGTDVFGEAKLNAEVMSRVTERRQCERLGTSAPKRVSRKRSVEVWSKVSEQTNPPRENGETTSVGTRNPSPIGPRMPAASELSGLAVTYSPVVPAGAVGGGTWSKKPPFSSKVMKSAVLSQTAGLEVRMLSTCCERYSPYSVGAGGCSLSTIDPSTHETCGS